MSNITTLKEEKNEIHSQMQSILAENDLDENEKARNKFDELKEKFENKQRELFVAENESKATIERNKEDGENKEIRENFKMVDALNYAAGREDKVENAGFYREVTQQGTEQARNKGVSLEGGFVIPSNVIQNAVDVTTEGDDLLFDQEGGFIQALRNKLVLSDLGTMYMDNLSGDVRMPKQTTVSTFSWEGETATGSAADTAYGNVTLSPKRGFVSVPVSKQMLAQESIGMERLVRRDIFDSIARGVEDAAINAGTTNGPNGILDISSAVTSAGSGSGDFYKDVVELEATVSGKNIRGGQYGYLLDTGLRATAKQSFKDSGSGMSVWEPGNTINGYNTGVTEAVAADQLIFGDFSQLIIGDFSGIELIADPYSKKNQGIIEYTVNVYMGVAIRHDEAFAHVDYS